MSRVCSHCIGESYLSSEISEQGQRCRCDFCESTEYPTVNIDVLAERVHSVLEEHFFMTSPDPEGMDYLAAKYGYWEQPGEPITDVILNLIDSSEALAEAVREYLSDQYDPVHKDALIDPCRYAIESQYDEKAIETYKFQESWQTFRKEIISKARFFNQSAKSALDHLFHGIEGLTTRDGSPVVRVLGSDSVFFRARLAKTFEELQTILSKAPGSLGAPPGDYAAPGRMNAEGISVFYGATDVETCIREIRAPVGSRVVSGRFSPLRQLRVLDLTRLTRVFLQGSLFDPAHSEALSRVQFLKELVSELSQPVMPGSESRKYLPTQAVAEYLAAHPAMALDGVMFASSQIGRPQEAPLAPEESTLGKNVVLFAHATELEEYELPEDAEVTVNISWGDPNEPEPHISVWETLPRVESSESGSVTGSASPQGDRGEDACGWDTELSGPSIRLDMDSIEVREINGVSYDTSALDVSRHRTSSDLLGFMR